MSNSYRFLIISGFLFSSSAFAMDVFIDPLYWRATETVDWVLINSNRIPNQNITYKTIQFDYDPGFRIGLGFKGAWDYTLSYTRYHTSATDSASGNLVSTFLGGKLVQGNNFFYQSGQVNFKLNYNVLDCDLSTCIEVTEDLRLRPVFGLRGSWINQRIITDFQGPISITENVKNNFRGIGPKVGIETNFVFCRTHGYEFTLFSNFTTSYLWGRWAINDVTHTSLATNVVTKVGSRNFGAFTLQGIMGVGLNCGCFSMKLGYELGDWFNQYQVLDDGTGAHNNDLILQGITLRASYAF